MLLFGAAWREMLCGVCQNIIIYIWKITQHIVPNIDGTIGHTIKTRKHPRHGTQYVIQYPTNRNPGQSLQENAITVFAPRLYNSLPKYLRDPARVRVGRVTDCGVRGLGFKSLGLDSNFLNRNQLSITSGQGWMGPMLWIVKWVKKKSPVVESSTWPLNSNNCSENYTKTKTKHRKC